MIDASARARSFERTQPEAGSAFEDLESGQAGIGSRASGGGLRWPLLMALLLGASGLLGGCVTSATTLQPARTLAPGDVRLVAGMGLPVSTRFFGEAADLIELSTDGLADAAATGRDVTVEEQREAIESVTAILLLQPSPVFELSGRLGLIEHLDIGLRWAGPVFELGAKYQFVDSPRFDLAGSLAYGYHTGIGASLLSSAFGLFESLKLVEYSRHDLNLGLLASGSREAIFMPYGALR
ncbi:MAG: hypothetical protein OEY14_18700, partial [Myxococcales bacterium]|nr:hypothetical protein [Myxococcales bacterium]